MTANNSPAHDKQAHDEPAHDEPTRDGQQGRDYARIAAAIAFIDTHFQAQPSLDEVAAAIHLSPFHCQRLFSRWAGLSPKKFTQFIALDHAKQLLATTQAPVLDAAYEAGLSGGWAAA